MLAVAVVMTCPLAAVTKPVVGLMIAKSLALSKSYAVVAPETNAHGVARVGFELELFAVNNIWLVVVPKFGPENSIVVPTARVNPVKV